MHEFTHAHARVYAYSRSGGFRGGRGGSRPPVRKTIKEKRAREKERTIEREKKEERQRMQLYKCLLILLYIFFALFII